MSAQRSGGTDHHGNSWGIAFFDSEGATPHQLGKDVPYFVEKKGASTSPIARMLRT